MVPVVNCSADGAAGGAAADEVMTPHDFFKAGPQP